MSTNKIGDFTTISDDFKATTNKTSLNKHEHELFDETHYKETIEPVVRVKHLTLPNKGDRWKVFLNDELVVVVEGIRLNKKEKAFLRGLAGVSWLIAETKAGRATSFSAVKVALKTHMKSLAPKKA